jgi:3-hydroxymyristoyl/3-hydroxydecanoyl-(acyl carrier protein) dehydratase
MAEIHLSLQIPQEHPSFPGHFPGQPIVPGVVLLDEVMQAIEREMPEFGLFSGGSVDIPVCKFLAPVFPGARLSLMLTWEGNGAPLTFKLHQAGQTVASGSLRAGKSP